MKLTRRQLDKIIKESLLNELTYDIIGTPGIGGDARAASRQQDIVDEYHPAVSALGTLLTDFSPMGFVLDVGRVALALEKIYKSGGDQGKIDLALAGAGFLPGAGDLFAKGTNAYIALKAVKPANVKKVANQIAGTSKAVGAVQTSSKAVPGDDKKKPT